MEEGLLEGNIILEMSDSKQCVRLENLMIKAYWEQYGKDNSYNRSCIIGKDIQFSNIGLKHPGINKGENNPMCGVEPWNKGKKGSHLSEEHKKKISETLKGRPSPMKGKKPWNTGKHLSEETKRKISESKRKKEDN